MKYLLSLSILLLASGCTTLCTKIIGASYHGPQEEVDGVFAGSPAEKAGIKIGDLLLAKYDKGTKWMIMRPIYLKSGEQPKYQLLVFSITPVCGGDIKGLKPSTWEDTAKGNDGSTK